MPTSVQASQLAGDVLSVLRSPEDALSRCPPSQILHVAIQHAKAAAASGAVVSSAATVSGGDAASAQQSGGAAVAPGVAAAADAQVPSAKVAGRNV